MLQKIREYVQYKIDRFLKDIGLRKKIVVDMTHTQKKASVSHIDVESLSDSELRIRILEKKLKDLEKKK